MIVSSYFRAFGAGPFARVPARRSEERDEIGGCAYIGSRMMSAAESGRAPRSAEKPRRNRARAGGLCVVRGFAVNSCVAALAAGFFLEAACDVYRI